MKINSIGINAYQEMTGRTQVSKRPVEMNTGEQIKKSVKIRIPGRADKVGSDISVKLRGENYADMLKKKKKQALELLFEKYGDKRGIIDSGTADRPGLGTFVDVKL